MKLKTKHRELLLILVLILGLVLLLAGCKTVKPVIVEKTKTEYRDRYVRDSVFYRDTTRIHTRGDTVFVDVVRWRDRWRIKNDSIIITDSIPIIVEVPVEVNKLTWWQNIRLKAFNIILITLFILL